MADEEPVVELTLQAIVDIVEIGVDTLERWGAKQKERYLADLKRRLNLLASFPLSGVPRPDIGPLYRSVPFHAHTIFYHAVTNGIRVVRVRPARMDPARHLLPDPWDCP